jgi:hypothetical protein
MQSFSEGPLALGFKECLTNEVVVHDTRQEGLECEIRCGEQPLLPNSQTTVAELWKDVPVSCLRYSAAGLEYEWLLPRKTYRDGDPDLIGVKRPCRSRHHKVAVQDGDAFDRRDVEPSPEAMIVLRKSQLSLLYCWSGVPTSASVA